MNATSKEMLEQQLNPEKQNKYFAAIQNALNFAGNAEGDVHDALFMMGLTINNLALVPRITAEPKTYWITAPAPAVEGSWDDSVIAEISDYYEAP